MDDDEYLDSLMSKAERTLDDVANDVRGYLTGAVENIIKAGKALQEGRDMHKSDELFGKWCKQEFPDLHRNTRTALMQIGNRFSAHKNVHTGFSVLRELAAPSVPDDLAEGFLSSPEPVKVKDVQEAKANYKEMQSEPVFEDIKTELDSGNITAFEATERVKEQKEKTEAAREKIQNSVPPNVIDLNAIAKDTNNTDLQNVGPAFIALMEKLCSKFDDNDIKKELSAFMHPDPIGLKVDALHKMTNILTDLCVDFPVKKLKNLN